MASLPPGPRSWLAATIAYVRDPMAAHERWRAQYGDPFTTFLGRNQTVITARTDAIRDIFAAPVGAYAASSLALEEIGGAQSVMTLEGSAHVAMRRVLNAALVDRRNELSPGIILEIARRRIAGWPRGRAVAALPLLSRIALEAILRAVCGVRDDAAVERFAGAFEGLNRSLGGLILLIPALRRDFGRWSPWGRFVRARRALTDLFDVEIAAARAAAPGERTDALANMVAMTGDDGRPALDEAALHDNLIALLFAGHLTTASSLAWGVHWIWATPGVLDRLKKELEDFSRDGDPDAALTAPYLEAVCRETLRIRPVSPLLARTLAGPMMIAGHLAPAGMGIGVSIDLAHHDPAVYPDPGTFDPTRFLNRRHGAAQFLPFGGGRRYCLGAALAMEEMRLVLAVLATSVELRLVSDRTPKRGFVSGATVPKGGVKIVVSA